LLAGRAPPAFAQPAPARPVAQAPALAPQSAPQMQSIRAITVSGAQRLEPGTVLSYTKLRVGSPYNRESLDLALKDLFATELFSDVQIRDDQGNLTIEIKEDRKSTCLNSSH